MEYLWILIQMVILVIKLKQMILNLMTSGFVVASRWCVAVVASERLSDSWVVAAHHIRRGVLAIFSSLLSPWHKS
ncbi:hypothetical protein VNO80_05517 [Phaseolus coccineus]|uniref:Uncharacterized protein n=1 Tax=Phaseolus coccineus TaxID=3886 RepID=A0AAN9NG01_PHACN